MAFYFNLGFERDVGLSLCLDFGYVGLGLHLDFRGCGF